MQTHCDEESVTVGNFVVDDGLKIYSFQLELYGDINEPERERECLFYSFRLLMEISE